MTHHIRFRNSITIIQYQPIESSRARNEYLHDMSVIWLEWQPEEGQYVLDLRPISTEKRRGTEKPYTYSVEGASPTSSYICACEQLLVQATRKALN
jgi:hypothetical protein